MIVRLDTSNIRERSDIVRLMKESYLAEARLINFFDIPGLKDDEEDILHCGEIFFGYKIDNQLVGIISFKIIDTVLDIHRVAVDPLYFKRGIASEMIKEIESLRFNISKIIVSTGSENLPACKLYEKLGYKKTGEKAVADRLVIAQFEKIMNSGSN